MNNLTQKRENDVSNNVLMKRDTVIKSDEFIRQIKIIVFQLP